MSFVVLYRGKVEKNSKIVKMHNFGGCLKIREFTQSAQAPTAHSVIQGRFLQDIHVGFFNFDNSQMPANGGFSIIVTDFSDTVPDPGPKPYCSGLATSTARNIASSLRVKPRSSSGSRTRWKFAVLWESVRVTAL